MALGHAGMQLREALHVQLVDHGRARACGRPRSSPQSNEVIDDERARRVGGAVSGSSAMLVAAERIARTSRGPTGCCATALWHRDPPATWRDCSGARAPDRTGRARGSRRPGRRPTPGTNRCHRKPGSGAIARRSRHRPVEEAQLDGRGQAREHAEVGTLAGPCRARAGHQSWSCRAPLQQRDWERYATTRTRIVRRQGHRGRSARRSRCRRADRSIPDRRSTPSESAPRPRSRRRAGRRRRAKRCHRRRRPAARKRPSRPTPDGAASTRGRVA